MVSAKWLVIAVAVLSTFVASCTHSRTPKTSPAKLQSTDFNIHRKVLKNGLTLIMVEDRSVPIVAYATWFRVGSAWDPPNATGIAHLFEHMMFKGTPKYSGKAFFNNLESRGAMVNAYTQKDATVYYEVISPQHLELVIDMESDRLSNLAITQEQLDTERAVVKEERRLRVDSDFGAQQMEELHKIAFGNHPYSWPVIGYEQDLNLITLQQCREFFSTYYQPANAIVVIAGNFDPKQVEGWMEKYYGTIPGKPVIPLSPPVEPLLEGERRKTLLRPVEAEGLLVGYRTPEIGHADMPALSMLSWALFEMGSSRATKTLVREKQVAIRVGGFVDQSKYPGLFYINADLRSGVPAELVLREIDKLVHEVKVKPITEQELQRVKNRLTYSVISETKSPFSMASWLASGEFHFGNYLEAFDLLDKYRKITTADLLRVARVYLRSDNRIVVMLKPSKNRGGAKE